MGELFTVGAKSDILRKVDVRCPACGRLLFKIFVLVCNSLPPALAAAVEIKCERCGELIGWPTLLAQLDKDK